MTPYGVFKGKALNIYYSKVFGSKCYIHNNGETNYSKFDTMSEEAIFIGYSFHIAYRFYIESIKVIEESIHVVFDKSNDGCISSSTC